LHVTAHSLVSTV